jgi:hypothetical protein
MSKHISNYLWGKHGIRYVDFYEHLAQEGVNFKDTPVVSTEIRRLHDLSKKIQEGNPRAQVVPEFGNFTWEPEEASFLRFVKDAPQFYEDLFTITGNYLNSLGRSFYSEEVKEVFDYQRALMPQWSNPERTKFEFKHNIPEFMDKFFDKDRPKIYKRRQALEVKGFKNFDGDMERFARETVLWGRRSNAILHNATWSQK